MPSFKLIAVAGLALRVGALFIGPGFFGDEAAFGAWARGMAEYGLDYRAAGGWGNYPLVLWLLWPLGFLTGTAQQVAIRALSIPFDLAIGWVLYRELRNRGEGGARVAAAAWLLNPAVIIAGALWGQVDAIGALPMLGATLLATRKPATAGGLAALAVLVKPQFAIGAILVAIALPRRKEAWARAVAGAVIAVDVVLLPLGIGPGGYASLLVSSVNQYGAASSYAFNLWGWLLGFGPEDGAWRWPATVAFVAAVAAIVIVRRDRTDLAGLLATGALIGLALYFIPTRVHDRYLYGAIVFLAPIAGIAPRTRRAIAVLSAWFAAALYYSLAHDSALGYPPIRLDRLGISAGSVAMIVAGLWAAVTAWQVRPASGPDPSARLVQTPG